MNDKSVSSKQPAGSEPAGEGLSDEVDMQLLEQARRQQPQLVGAVLDAISSYVMFVRYNGSIEYANKALVKLIGLPVDEIHERQVWDVFSFGDEYLKLRAFFSCDDGAAVLTGCMTQLQFEGSQTARHIVWRRHLCYDENRRCQFMIASGWDATEQEVLRRKLHYQGQQYKQILNNIPIAVEEVDTQGIVTFSNEAHARLHGKRPVDVMGMPVWELDLPEKREGLRRYIHELFRDQPEPVPYQTKMKGPDGTEVDLEVNWNYRHDDTGRLMGLTAILLDITAHQQTREVLDETQERFESVFHACPMMISLTTMHDGRVAEINEAVEEVLGYTRQEVIGSRPDDLGIYLNPADRAAYFQEITCSGRAFNLETEIRRKDGQIISGLLAGEKVLIGDQEYVLSYFIDISARKQAEEALRESEERYRALFEYVPQAISVTTPAGRILAYNHQFSRLYGYSDDELTQLDIHRIYTRLEDRRHLLDTLEHDGYVRDFEVMHQTKSDELKHILMSVVPIGWEGQASLLSIFQDITDLIHTQQRLAESERLLAHISDNTPANILVYDQTRSRNIYANRRYAEFYGVSLEEANQVDHTVWRERIHRDDLDKVLRYENARNRQGDDEIVHYEFRMKNVGGDYRWLHAWRTVFARDEKGRPTQFLGVTMDVTERKQAEAEREVLIDQLRQSQKLEAIGTLASGVAHDYYNLMMVINSATDYARKTINEDHVAYASFDIIEKACHQAAEITRALRAFSQTGQMAMGDLDLRELLTESIELIRRMMPSTISIETCWQDNQPIMIQGHRGYLQQVLINLMVNARDAMDGSGCLTVRMAIVPVRLDADHSTPPLRNTACITIEDTGCGMSKPVQERIFEPFYTTKPRGKGTGLGLAVVHGIINDHSGRIEVESEVSVGTRMKVYLPLIELQA